MKEAIPKIQHSPEWLKAEIKELKAEKAEIEAKYRLCADYGNGYQCSCGNSVLGKTTMSQSEKNINNMWVERYEGLEAENSKLEAKLESITASRDALSLIANKVNDFSAELGEGLLEYRTENAKLTAIAEAGDWVCHLQHGISKDGTTRITAVEWKQAYDTLATRLSEWRK